jgi:hypothetical protein
MHVRRPFSEGRAWFEVTSPPPKENREKVSHGDKAVEVLRQTDGRGMRWTELRQRIEADFGVSEAMARRAIDDAKASGAVASVSGVYFLK